MTNTKTEIVDVYGFLKEIQNSTEGITKATGLKHFAYRGENESYEVHSIPNLFRGSIFEMYNDIDGFEKNIIDEVSSNKLTKHDKSLEIAMDAQHGGFPSRLLDITFNSLSALFFAVTPHYTQDVDCNDDKDAQVIIYAIDKMSTSNSDYINDLYNKIIKEKDYNKRFDGYYHYFIDYVELNPRIKAQQGGFILFCGNQHVPIPEWKQKAIKIPGKSKPLLREQLKTFFDITMGSIYPEPSNKVDFLVEKSNLLIQQSDHYDNIFEEINQNIQWYDEEISYFGNKKDIEKRNQQIIRLELYMTAIMDSLEDYKIAADAADKELELKKYFNEIINKVNRRYGEKKLKKID